MSLSEQIGELQIFIQSHTQVWTIFTNELHQIYTKLVDCLVDNNHLYYIKNSPIISDKEYDDLFAYLKKLEESHPDLISSSSPTQDLVGQVSDWFQQAKHANKLASLENTYDAEDLRERDNRAKKVLEKDQRMSNVFGRTDDEIKYSYIIEPKFDGLSVELIYKWGKFTQAITRGDGRVGDDITTNVKTIKNIPKKLNSPVDLHVRGEIMMPKSVRKEINDQRESDGETPFANTRNAAAGSIKLLDSKEVEKRWLVCYVYDILDLVKTIKNENTTRIDIYSKNISGEKSSEETENILESLWLPVYPRTRAATSIEEIITICEDSQVKQALDTQDIDFDGLVIKVKEENIRHTLGNTEHHPRRAVAYKFPAQIVSTKIISVDFQVGRTWILTPVGNLEPVELSGVTIKRVSLHNADFIASKDLHIWDYIRLQRSGEVIPYVVGVISERRTGEEKPIGMPDQCPSCGGVVIQDDMYYYCTNDECPQKLKEQITHFVSKQALDIQGIWESIIDVLVDQKIIKDIADMYLLTDPNTQFILRKFPGFADKKVAEMVNSIEASKTQALRRLLNGLGISHVGKKLAQDIEKQMAQFLCGLTGEIRVQELIKTLTNKEFLISLYGIWDITVETIANYFSDKSKQKLLYRMLEAGYQFVCETGNLREKEHFSITGTFAVPREIITQAFQKEWYVFDENPTKTTNFMLIWDKAGSKKEKAESMNIKLYTDREQIKKEFSFLNSLSISAPKKQVPQISQQSLF